jgi:hypothetical protein
MSTESALTKAMKAMRTVDKNIIHGHKNKNYEYLISIVNRVVNKNIRNLIENIEETSYEYKFKYELLDNTIASFKDVTGDNYDIVFFNDEKNISEDELHLYPAYKLIDIIRAKILENIDNYHPGKEYYKESPKKYVKEYLIKNMLIDNKLITEVSREYEKYINAEWEHRLGEIEETIFTYIDSRKSGGRRKTRRNKKSNRKTKKKQFLYHPNDPKKSFDVYIDKNPKDTIPIKYTTIEDVKNTIHNLEDLYKKGKYSHKRIWQVGMIQKVRLEAMLKNKNKLYPHAKNVKKRFDLANKYFLFLKSRSKETDETKRKKMTFK